MALTYDPKTREWMSGTYSDHMMDAKSYAAEYMTKPSLSEPEKATYKRVEHPNLRSAPMASEVVMRRHLVMDGRGDKDMARKHIAKIIENAVKTHTPHCADCKDRVIEFEEHPKIVTDETVYRAKAHCRHFVSVADCAAIYTEIHSHGVVTSDRNEKWSWTPGYDTRVEGKLIPAPDDPIGYRKVAGESLSAATLDRNFNDLSKPEPVNLDRPKTSSDDSW